MRSFLRLAGLLCALSAAPLAPAAAQDAYPSPAHHHDRAVRGRRHVRRACTCGRRADGDHPRPAHHQREHCGGRRGDRTGACCARGGGRLYDRNRQCRHQCRDLHHPHGPDVQAGVVRSRCDDCQDLRPDRHQEGFRREDAEGIHRPRQGQSGQGDAGARRHRLLELSDLSDLREGRRHRGNVGRLSRRGTGAERSDRRADRRRLRHRDLAVER